MFDKINFVITQLQFLEVAMAQPVLSSFKPDAKTVANVAALRTAAEAAKTLMAQKLAAWQNARGATHGDCHDCHGLAVQFYGAARSVYRTLPNCVTALRRIPKQDKTARGTLDRMLVTSAVWSELPNPPGTTTPFQVGAVTRAAFDLLTTNFQTKVQTEVNAKAAFEAAQAGVATQVETLGSFMSAALAQGRSLFPEGTPARDWLDAIPTEPAAQPPDQAQITVAQSPANGAVHLEFNANRATSFQVWHKGPGEEQFTLVDTVFNANSYDKSGLAAGTHGYEIVGVNSRGEGAASAPATVAVAAAAAA